VAGVNAGVLQLRVDVYQRHGFIRSPLGERVMLMPIETVRSLLGK
jgi:hypothetical protein